MKKVTVEDGSDVPVWFETVPPFSKRVGTEKIKDRYTLDCFLAGDGESIVMFIDDGEMIPDVILHSEMSLIEVDENADAERMHVELQEKVSAMARKLIDEKGVNLVIVSVFDTVITAMGHVMQCVSLFSVTGYVC